ncbi:CHAD domain-containing protein [Sphingosinicella terrae]|uniref:CYTH and CHAD domain-containing protein n=1 Tax=Sphingosinicella terrae TaxID=2172047 RepID=UPI000E0D5E0C|nr:CHAD domain-containing protein [Sphingosinicella terrae]
MPHEVELKFDLDADGPALVGAAGALATTPTDVREHETVYFDTPDRRLHKAGYSLRVRRSGERCIQTIKRRNGGSVGLFVRDEWESEVSGFDIARADLAAGALKDVLSRAETASLVPLVTTRFRRTRWLIERGSGRIEVALDEGEVGCAADRAPIRELELELLEGKPGTLFRLAEEIGTAVPLRLGVLSKGERGYALADGRLGIAAKSEPVRLADGMELGEAFRLVASSCLRHFRLNEIALMGGGDGEAVHQARVAMRRLRTALSLFRPMLVGNDFQHLRRELRWATRQLGEARDLDVLVGRQGASTAQELLDARDEAHDQLRAVLRGARARALMLRLALWIEGGAWRYRKRSGGALAPFATAQLDRLWNKVQRRGARLAEIGDEARHRLRIDVKKLRYSAEFLSGLHGSKPAGRRRDSFLAALRDLQESLGDLNDLRVFGAVETEAEATAAALTDSAKAFDRAARSAGYWHGA